MWAHPHDVKGQDVIQRVTEGSSIIIFS